MMTTDPITTDSVREMRRMLCAPTPDVVDAIARQRRYLDAVREDNADGKLDIELAVGERDLLWLEALLALHTEAA